MNKNKNFILYIKSRSVSKINQPGLVVFNVETDTVDVINAGHGIVDVNNGAGELPREPEINLRDILH